MNCTNHSRIFRQFLWQSQMSIPTADECSCNGSPEAIALLLKIGHKHNSEQDLASEKKIKATLVRPSLLKF